ncbi:MAG: aminotransferase class I/II-fold pyridoxal phosphate-dependent enzyme [Pseudomonadales bacterium]|nr:aminotransferase class I/II-fold pyridoxal phosphate-dependent enzyme [Pseudomonadales bacterium]
MDVSVESKLPDVGTTIFTVMSALAQEHGAINLSQGFPDFDGPEPLLDRVQHYFNNGFNQYPPMQGVPTLRTAISGKVADLYGAKVDPDSEVTVTAGATEALFCAIAAVVSAGDEVIVFDPAYDSYDPVIRLQGARAIHIPLEQPSYRPDWQRVEDAITPRTKMIIINSPHNPTGGIWTDTDLAHLEKLVCSHELFVLSDEVYELIIFDGELHQSVCRFGDLYSRSFVVSSFGKTYHVTGWKVGYCVAPPLLTTEFRRIHQFVTFTVNTPVQLGLADFLTDHPEHHLRLPDFYQGKRDYFLSLMKNSRFTFEPSRGTYFQLLNYQAISQESDRDLAERWTKEIGVASIPVSVFYEDQQSSGASVLRFCFAKDDATLERAAEILCNL